MRRQYEELKKSLDFNNAELTSLKKENKELKGKVSSLEKSLSEVRADVDIVYEDLATAITQVDDVEQYIRKHKRFMESPKMKAKISLKMLLNLEKSSTCTFLPPISTFVTEWDLGAAAAPNLLLSDLNHIRRKLSCTKQGNI